MADQPAETNSNIPTKHRKKPLYSLYDPFAPTLPSQPMAIHSFLGQSHRLKSSLFSCGTNLVALPSIAICYYSYNYYYYYYTYTLSSSPSLGYISFCRSKTSTATEYEVAKDSRLQRCANYTLIPSCGVI